MTDTILPPLDLATLPPPPNDVLDPAAPTPQSKDDVCAWTRRWYAEAYGHELWKRYTEWSEESERFYIGGELQWGKEDAARLKAALRAMVTINHVQQNVRVLSGFERQNRLDLKTVPQGDEDSEAAQLMTWLLKFVQESTSCQDHITDGFEDGCIRGMYAWETGVDYTEDPVDGQVYVAGLKPGKDRDIIWDPHWSDYDLSDPVNGARYVLKTTWAFSHDLVARYPTKKAEIEQAGASLALIFQTMPGMDGGVTTDGPPADGYGSVSSHPVENLGTEQMFYSALDQRMLVIEVWYRTWEAHFLVADKKTGTVHEVDSMADARAMVQTDPKNLRAVERQVRKIQMATVLPAGWVVLEEPTTPYENDQSSYPFVVFTAERKGDYIYGAIENLKDPQRAENRRISQLLDILGRYANARPLIPKGSLVNPNVLENPADTSPIIYDPEKGEPKWFVPPIGELVRMLAQIAEAMKVDIREVGGVNLPLQGASEQGGQSGIALARLQAQGQVLQTPYFDRLRRSRRLIGQRLCRRIQQVFTQEQVVRLTNDVGTSTLVRLNPIEFRDRPAPDAEEWQQFRQQQKAEGKPDVLRDVSALKYDVVISEAPSTPSARATALLSLLDIIEKLPMLAPALIDVIVELADIPDRQRVLDRIKAIMAQQLGLAGGGAPPGPGPIPPPGGGAVPPEAALSAVPPGGPASAAPPSAMPGAA